MMSRLGVAARVVIALGAAIRVICYARGWSLGGLDESRMALNIGARSFVGLTRPLEFEQSAPLAWLWGERAMVLLGGVNAYALRAIPLAAGVAALVLTWGVARRLLGEREGIIATMLAAISTTGVLYATASNKPYGIDPIATLVVLALTIPLLRDAGSAALWCRLTVGGAVVMLCSQPVVFVLAGAAISLVGARPPQSRRTMVRRWLPMVIGWVLVFAGLYFWLYRPVAANPYMVRFWQGTYLTPSAPDFRARFFRAAWASLAGSFFLSGTSVPGAIKLTVAAFVAGLAFVARRHGTRVVVLLGAPFLMVGAAGVLGRYPFAPRLEFFDAPLVGLVFATLCVGVVDLCPLGWRRAVYSTEVVALLLCGVWELKGYSSAPPGYEDLAAVVGWIDHRKIAEPVYVSSKLVPGWVFYTTDWKRPDTERIDWVARRTAADQPAFENRAPRSHAVLGEGEELALEHDDRLELIGIGSGMQYVYDVPVPPAPDTGWAMNEVLRLHRAANPSGWLLLSTERGVNQVETNAILSALREVGASVQLEQEADAVQLYRVQFPAAFVVR
jgi:hypothetical protein